MKSQTLKENKDFRRLYYRGQNISSAVLVTYAMRSRRGTCRVGITTGKKIGGAVQRNRCRRIIRAAYADIEDRIDGCWDFVFVARTRTSGVKMQDVRAAMIDHFVRIGVINDGK